MHGEEFTDSYPPCIILNPDSGNTSHVLINSRLTLFSEHATTKCMMRPKGCALSQSPRQIMQTPWRHPTSPRCQQQHATWHIPLPNIIIIQYMTANLFSIAPGYPLALYTLSWTHQQCTHNPITTFRHFHEQRMHACLRQQDGGDSHSNETRERRVNVPSLFVSLAQV